VLLLRLLNPHISLLFSDLSTGLRSTNALNINFFLLPIKLMSEFPDKKLEEAWIGEPPEKATENRDD